MVVQNKYHRTCWLCLQPLQLLCLVNKVWSSFLDYPMEANHGRFDQPFVMALMLNALNFSWFLIFLYVGGGIPSDECLVHERLLGLVPHVSQMNLQNWRQDTPSLLANCSSLTCSPNGCRTSHLGLHGTFRGLSSLVSSS